MKKNHLSREQIIETTLNLINQEQGLHNVNLREIARNLGCAHTNIYNYFQDFNELLWHAVDAAATQFVYYITQNLDSFPDEGSKLEHYFYNYIDFYLNNRGWFKLIWFEQVGGGRPKESIELSYHIVDQLTETLRAICCHRITAQQAHYLLHTVHCYIHGEISIFLAGRGLIKAEPEFRNYVKKESLKLFGLLLNDMKKG